MNSIFTKTIKKMMLLSIVFISSQAKIFGQEENPKLSFSHLTGNFYIYITYNNYKNHQVPANGMYLVTNAGIVLFDTPWDTTQFQPLLDSIKARHQAKVIMCVSTHWHSDRTAGLEYYKKLGIKTYTTTLTDELSKKNGKPRAEFLMTKDTVFNIGQYAFETYFPGEGHTIDNIVIWFKKEKILYGGCLIKSTEDHDLGFLGDANQQAYASTIKNVQKKCGTAKFVIVGHDDWGDKKSLEHTLKMAEGLRR